MTGIRKNGEKGVAGMRHKKQASSEANLASRTYQSKNINATWTESPESGNLL
jgi:hypothetical protein